MFDRMNPMTRSSWRRDLLKDLQGEILEVGVGTGINLRFYPEHVHVTGIDFSPKMLARARRKLKDAQATVTLKEMNIERMDFADNTFDAVVSTCVFCSVPNPIQVLKEIRRVVKKEGKVMMLEHMRSENVMFGKMLDLLNPLTVRLIGTNVNRATIKNIEQSGMTVK